MIETQILYPVFAQVALTFILMFWTGYVRVGAANRREVRLKDIALGQKAWPDGATKVSNSFNSQFEMPMLFYVAALVAIAINGVTFTMVALAWVFVVTRIVHVAIYTTTNNLRQRLSAYAIGAVAVMVMWILLALRLLFAGA